MASITSDAHPPAFLVQPLESTSLFDRISSTLRSREDERLKRLSHSHRLAQTGQRDHGRYTTFAASSPDNMSKNRYLDLATYDRTRVLFPHNPTEGDYINATLIREPDLGFGDNHSRRWWIATQSPTPGTLYSFWSLFLSRLSSTETGEETVPPPNIIVQLNLLPYAPYFEGEVGVYQPSFTTARAIWVRLETRARNGNCIISTFTVGWEGEEVLKEKEKTITHFQYLSWPDGGVPTDFAEIKNIMTASSTLNQSLTPESQRLPPIVVHCLAGIGRTGTYLAVASLLPILSLLRFEQPVDASRSTAGDTNDGKLAPYPSSELSPRVPRDYVGETVDHFREHRAEMVETEDQLRWIYQALLRNC